MIVIIMNYTNPCYTDRMDPLDYIVEKLSRKLAENDKRGIHFFIGTSNSLVTYRYFKCT